MSSRSRGIGAGELEGMGASVVRTSVEGLTREGEDIESKT